MGFGKKDKSAFSVHRSEEVMPNTLRHLVRQSSSLSSNEGLGGSGGGERSDRSDRDLIGGKSSGSGRANLSTSVASSNSSGGGSHKSGGGGGSSSKSNSRKASPASTSGSRLKAASAPPSVESDDSRDKDG